MPAPASLPPIPLYQAITRNEQSDIDAFAKSDPPTKADLAYFTRQASALTTPAQLLKDYRSLRVVLGAFGMEDAIAEPALLRTLMTQDPNDPKSFVKQVNNPAYTRFAGYFSNWTPPPLTRPDVVAAVTSQYQQTRFEANEDQQSPGMGAALAFRAAVSSSTTLSQIMADPVLLKVVEGATDQPLQFGLLDYTQQVRILTQAVPMKQFQTASGIDRFVQRYLAMNQANPPPPAQNEGITSLFGADAAGVSILNLFG